MFCFVFLFQETPLHLAAQNGHLGVVDYLINRNADIKAKTGVIDGHLSIKTLVKQAENRVVLFDTLKLLFIMLHIMVI